MRNKQQQQQQQKEREQKKRKQQRMKWYGVCNKVMSSNPSTTLLSSLVGFFLDFVDSGVELNTGTQKGKAKHQKSFVSLKWLRSIEI